MRRWVKPFTSLVVGAGLLLFSSGCAEQHDVEDSDDVISVAWTEYSLGEFDRAIRKFEQVMSETQPQEELHLSAMYGLATTWNLRRPGEDHVRAVDYYNRIIALNPESDFAAWSRLALARMKHLVPIVLDPDYAEVRAAYKEVIDKHPDHLAAKEAFIYLVATYVSTLDEDDSRYALGLLKEFVKNPSNAFLGPAYSLMAVIYTTLNMQEERLWAEEESLAHTEVDPTNPFTEFAWHYWNLATISEFEVGDFEKARFYYNKLIEEYPTDIRVYTARQALRRMDELEARIRAEVSKR